MRKWSFNTYIAYSIMAGVIFMASSLPVHSKNNYQSSRFRSNIPPILT